MFRRRLMWQSLMPSPLSPLQTCAMPFAGTTTLSPTRTRRTGEEAEVTRGFMWWCSADVKLWLSTRMSASCQSSRCEEASGSIWSCRCGWHHLWLRPCCRIARWRWWHWSFRLWWGQVTMMWCIVLFNCPLIPCILSCRRTRSRPGLKKSVWQNMLPGRQRVSQPVTSSMSPTRLFDRLLCVGGCHDILNVRNVSIFPPDCTLELFLVLGHFCGNGIISSPTEPTLIAKSSILLDVKPWDDETDMSKLEECVRSIQMEGLIWGQCKCNIQIWGRERCDNTARFDYWLLLICRCHDDLTHHLSAEQEMTFTNLKALQRITIQIKRSCDKLWLLKLFDECIFGLCLAKLVPVGYGIKKLQIGCVVEDDKVSAPPSAVCGRLCCESCFTWTFPVCYSGGHRHPGGAHHCLWGLCSVDGRCSFQQNLKKNDCQ